jgi:DNA-binding CsgD family transcriptional regulator
MDERLARALIKYDLLFKAQHFDEAELDYSIMDTHVPFFNMLDKIDNSIITVFDLFKREHIYISPKFETFLGYSVADAHETGTDYFNQMIHPEDFIFLTEAGVYFMEMGLNLPAEKIREFKLITTFRMKKADGAFIRVLEQHSLLEFDKRGNIWLALSVLDFSPDQDLEAPAHSRLLNFKTGELYHFPPKELNETAELLTNREREVLGLLSKGFISKQIADKLFISVNTVNTHRQRIIEKLDVSNTAEAINHSLKIGIL